MTLTGAIRSLSRSLLFLVAASVLAPGIAAAQTRLVIHRVEVDEPAALITITGSEFGEAAPEVTLEGVPVAVISHTQSEVVIGLPPGTTPGTYLLTVTRSGLGPFNKGSVDVAIGAEGPQGPQGVPGPQGDTGPQGEQGPQGEAGP